MTRLLSIAAICFFAMGTANAGPIDVDPTATGSSVNAQITSSSCLFCFVDASLSDGLDGAFASLDTGESFTFDFIDIVVGGLIGSANVQVDATLALAGLVGPSATGIGGFSSFLFVLNKGYLNWIQPDAIDLGDGTFLGVSFENLFAFGIGNTATVSATVTRFGAAAVPEPGTAALLFLGLLVLWFAAGRPALMPSRSRMSATA